MKSEKMKLNQLKTRFIISGTVGLIGLLIFNGLLGQIKYSNVVNFSSIQNALWKIIPYAEAFLVPFVICLFVISIPVIFNKSKLKEVVISLVIGTILVFGTFNIESELRQKKLAYETYHAVQVTELYEKMMRKGDIDAISEIAVHPNLPDSIKENLSESKFMEIRRSIAFETDSEEILKKLSSDKEWEVRLAVATNKLTPIETMNKLQLDTNEDVRNIANSMVQQSK